MDKFVNKIKTATGWESVAKVNDSYVLSFDMNDIPVIKGLVIDQAADTFYLEFEEFASIPISFLVKLGDNYNQYWTVNKRLHRSGDLPAFVSYNRHNDIVSEIIRRWYWNGLLHRTTGPARETICGYEREELDELPHHYKEKWSLMKLEWWEEGIQGHYESPCKADIYNGWRYRKKSNNALDNFEKDAPAFGANLINISWLPGYMSTKQLDALVPYRAELSDMVEYYINGQYQKREADGVAFEWAKDGVIINPVSDHVSFDDIVKKNLLNGFNLWKKPFYKDEEAEFLTIAEFGRIYDNN